MNSSIANGDQGARRPGASTAPAEGPRPVSAKMVRMDGVCLNSALDCLHDWNTALNGEFGPYAHVIIDEVINDPDVSVRVGEVRIEGPRP